MQFWHEFYMVSVIPFIISCPKFMPVEEERLSHPRRSQTIVNHTQLFYKVWGKPTQALYSKGVSIPCSCPSSPGKSPAVNYPKHTSARFMARAFRTFLVVSVAARAQGPRRGPGRSAAAGGSGSPESSQTPCARAQAPLCRLNPPQPGPGTSSPLPAPADGGHAQPSRARPAALPAPAGSSAAPAGRR